MVSLPLVFGCILFGSFLLLHLMLRPPPSVRAVKARFVAMSKARKKTLADDHGLVREESQGINRLVSDRLKNYHFADDLGHLIVHAGSGGTVGSIALSSVGLALAGALLAHVLSGALALVVLASMLGGSLRYVLLTFQKTSRLKRFDAALPDAIELMARALRAGHSMGSSIEIIAEQSVEPLKGEFALCFQQQKFGIPFRDALLAMNDRVPSKDLRFLITAVLVQKETGGDLTEILDRTTRVSRERIRIQGEVRTHTAQGRLTGWILGLMPVMMLALLNMVSPGYSDVLFSDPFGQKLLYAGGVMVVVGGLIIRNIVDINI
jgi:tight adherence protein B